MTILPCFRAVVFPGDKFEFWHRVGTRLYLVDELLYQVKYIEMSSGVSSQLRRREDAVRVKGHEKCFHHSRESREADDRNGLLKKKSI